MTVAAKVSDNVWDARADSLVNCVRPVIAWARCEKGLSISDDPLPAMLSLQALTGIVRDRKLPVPVAGGRIELVDLAAAPAELFAALLGYLDDLPCYNPCRASGVEQPEQALAQHSYVLMRVPSVLSASSP